MKNKVIMVVLSIVLFIITALTLSDDKTINFTTKPIKDTMAQIDSMFTIKRENTSLENTIIKELQKEINDLKETLELTRTLSEYDYINATVVNRNIGYWYNTLTIDKGLKNGINNGDAVITNDGLIGKTIQCSNFSCTVKLLTSDNDNKISIKINNEDKYYYGLLVGYDFNRNIYKIEGVSDVNNIKEGLTVTTTGLTDYFPSGILIGNVSSIIKDEYDLTAVIEVIPSVDFNDINIVTVLKRKNK